MSNDIGCFLSVALLMYAVYIIRGGGGSVPKQYVYMRPGVNKIILADGEGRFLVEAAQADDITGGPDMQLPAHVQKVHMGLYMVDFTGPNVTDVRDHAWRTASGRIDPRTPNMVSEALLPPSHEYVRPK